MKLSIFLLFVTIFNVFGSKTYSQNARMNLDMKDVPIRTVLNAIEGQSEFFFLYSSKMIDITQKVDINVADKKITEVLDELLTNTEIKYAVRDRQILLVNKEAEAAMGLQQNRVTGIVTDKNGAPVPGVNVVVTGTTQGTMTDIAGKYSIEIPKGSKSLTFSFIGMETQEITIGILTQINVTMAESAIGLEEVVVIGYGTMKKSDLTGAVVSVSSDKLKNTISNTFDQALQGKAAGVQVTVNSGQPGAATTIRIRGTNSLLGSNEPLYVIDGIQISGESERVFFTGNGGNTAAMRTSPLSNLNPNDIESIEVLKDASAAAIYGNRGANGVIIVTTKKGKLNEAKITYDYNFGLKYLANKIDVMGLKDYAIYNNELAAIESSTPRAEFANPDALGKGTDWQDEIFETGKVESHNLSLSGGNEKTTYYISSGYNNDNGPVVNSWMERFSFRANLDSKIKQWATFGNNLSFGRSNTKYIMSDASDSPLYLALSKGPDVPVYDEEGNFVGVNPGGDVRGGGLGQTNPIAVTDDRDSRKKKFDIYNSTFLDIKIKDFSFRTEVSFTGNFTHDYAYYKTVEYAGFINIGSTL
ncbi:MAG: SusC/RagA family TonB-linked outer membrane protein, partial [Bacteroidales bacterium]|nr:SusC/RagA family TonB-linked outer membrane protein [Bacteroidales bacterium]